VEDKISRPSFQFYPNDWICHLELQSCSLAAQGLWINLMCRMHKSSVYGKLLLEQNGNQIPITAEKLAGLVGKTWEEIQPLVNELVSLKVMKVESGTGIFFCSRMVKDEDLRNKRAAAGKLGGETTQKSKAFAKSNHQANFKQTVEEEDKEEIEDEAVVLNIEERQNLFWEKVCEHTEFTQELRMTFFDYWTEHNEGGKKMRFEMEKVFDIKKRLNTFLRNDKKNFKNNNSNSGTSHVQERVKQNIDQKERNKEIFKDEPIGKN
jgi:hypothetical protein